MRKKMIRRNKYSNENKVYDGIRFKSLLEMRMYKIMKEAGLNPKYEFHKYCLMEGFYPTKPFFEPDKNKKLSLKYTSKKGFSKVLDITYTPDFAFYHKGILIVIETKGFQTAEYKLKRKLFRKYMENMGDVVFFEVHTLKQLNEAITVINNL